MEAIEGAPEFVLGLSIIRGHPTPVVDLARLLGAKEPQPVSRFVTVHLGERTLALAAGAVLGVRALDPSGLEPLPKILGLDGERVIQSIGQLDGGLLVVLQAMSLLPEAVWRRIVAGDVVSP